MASSVIQIRVDDELRTQAAEVFEQLGIDIPTAVRMFMKRAVMENGIPFGMTLPRKEYKADLGVRAMMQLGEEAEKHGVADMTLEEINAEIKAAREEIKIGNGAAG